MAIDSVLTEVTTAAERTTVTAVPPGVCTRAARCPPPPPFNTDAEGVVTGAATGRAAPADPAVAPWTGAACGLT